MKSLMSAVAEAKKALRDAGIRGATLAELVDNAVAELTRLRQRDAEARQVLRSAGFDPAGKRLPDAVWEAVHRPRQCDQ